MTRIFVNSTGRLIALCAVLSLAGTAAQARIGETPGQSASRYGEPVDSRVAPILKGADQEVYHFNGWQVVAAFVDGRTARIEYSKLRDYEGHDSVVIQSADIEALLKGEQAGGEWTEVKEESTGNPFKAFARAVANTTKWTNSAGGITAELRLNRMNMTFVSPEAEKAAGTPSSPEF